MSDETNVAVTTEAPTALKSNDTSSKAKETTVVETAKPEPKVVEKVEAKAEADAKPPEGDTDAPDADSPQAGKEKRLPRWMKERLERERQVTEARTREAMLREFQSSQPAAQQPANPEAPTLKTLEDFNFNQTDYVKYLVKVEREQERQAERLEYEQKKQAAAQESFKSHVDAFEEKVGDGAWDDIVSSPLNTKPEFKPLTELFMGDEHDLEIAHYLATNMKEAERINGLPRLAQVREIAKLADRFEGVTEEKPVTPPKKTTSAPPPVKTISGAGKPSVDINDPAMSTAERIKAWKKQGSAR